MGPIAGALFLTLFLIPGGIQAAEGGEETAISADAGPLPLVGTFNSIRASLLSRLSLNGYLRNEIAFRVNEPTALTKILNILNLDARYPLWRSAEMRARVRTYYDAVYDFQDIDTVSPRRGPVSVLTENPSEDQLPSLEADNVRNADCNQEDFEVRELHMDMHFRNADLRVGKQIVRWGVVEGARVTDEINPLDLGEFILRDVEDRYIPLTMLKTDYYLGPHTLEAIWIPDLQFHKPAARECEWEQFRLLPGLQEPASPLDNPVKNMKNSEIALRLSTLLGGWDLSFSYFYTWDDFPAAFRSIGVIGFGATPQVNPVDFHPRYTRLHIPGFTVSKSLGRLVLNAEAAYVFDKIFGVRIESLPGPGGGQAQTSLGEIDKDYIKYAIGLDTTLWGTDISGQILQQHILGYQTDIIQDEFDTVLGLFLRKPLLSNALTAQVLTLHFINDREWLIRPKLQYRLTDQVKFSFGADLLLGTIADLGPDGAGLPGEFHFVGFFRNNSRVYTEIQYSF